MNSNSNSCGFPRVFPSPKETGCEVLPYDGGVEGDRYNVYSSKASENNLSCDKKYKYFRTCKVADQKDVWSPCNKRCGVVHGDCKVEQCDSAMDRDNVTEKSMYDAYDGKYAFNATGFKSLLGHDIRTCGNKVDTNVRDYHVYGAYTAAGGFVEDGQLVQPNCDQKKNYYGYMRGVGNANYVPKPPPKKQCLPDRYLYANGTQHPTANSSGHGAACGALHRDHEDHNEQYLKDHYAQFSNAGAMPSQAELDMYKTDFTLLNNGLQGTKNYASYANCVNPMPFDGKDRASNSHIPQVPRDTPSGPRKVCN